MGNSHRNLLCGEPVGDVVSRRDILSYRDHARRLGLVSMKLNLPFPISVNSAYGGGSGQRRFKSKRLKEWLAKCPKLFPIPELGYPVRITYKFYWPDKRQRDGQNYIKVVTDYLVDQGVIKDDSYEYIAAECWEHGGVDKDNPRVEIEIT
jgi:Holliday junction resolvase RusA-like endonuclease